MLNCVGGIRSAYIIALQPWGPRTCDEEIKRSIEIGLKPFKAEIVEAEETAPANVCSQQLAQGRSRLA